MVIYIIFELDRHKRGLITTVAGDKLMVDLRHMLDNK